MKASVADPNPNIKESENFGWIRIRKKNLDSDPTIRGDGKNLSICCNFHKQKVITQVRTSILAVHLHEKRIADTFENLYFV
jgi:hypothetical protein